MLPIRDVIPSRTRPRITLLLIACNLLVFGLVPVSRLPEDTWLALAFSGFQHTGVGHLAWNLAALWLFGENVEDRFGHGRFLACYGATAGAAAASDAWVASAGHGVPCGAAGPIAGVVAAYLVMFPRSRFLTLVPTGLPFHLIELPVAAVAAVWFLLQAARGSMWLTLFVGALAGVVAAWLLRRPDRDRVEWWAA